jgi:hypothetical protein
MADFQESSATRARINRLSHRPAAGASTKTPKFCTVLWVGCHGADYILKQKSDQPFPSMPTSSLPDRSDHRTPRPTAGRNWTLVGLFFLFFLFSLPTLLFSCRDDKKAKVDAPTEPWRKDESPDKKPKKPTVYQIESGQTLEFDLPTRRSKPGGTLREPRGGLRLDLEALESGAGEIVIDLNQLEFSAPPVESKTKLAKETKTPPIEEKNFEGMNWTVEAKRWLGLGARVAPQDRQRAARARFSFGSFREVSHVSARSGIKKHSSDAFAGEVREVRAIAMGELSVGDLVVQREVQLLLRFFFSDSDPPDSAPNSMEVHLREPLGIPLEEYRIAPKDDEGHLDSEKLTHTGTVVGSTVRIMGDLRLSRDPESR